MKYRIFIHENIVCDFFSPRNDMPAGRKYNREEVNSSWLLEVVSNDLFFFSFFFFFAPLFLSFLVVTNYQDFSVEISYLVYV